MEIFARLLIIIPALIVGGWAASHCKQRRYSPKKSFIFGVKTGFIVSAFIVLSFLLSGIYFDMHGNGQSFLVGISIIFFVGLSYGFYCWERAVRDGR
ncbi:MAG: hypothetical protein M0Q95_20350 [Porticoccaceae bacterium]|nr:hypothetical protein [Porticoccaceae bacterium]